MRIFLIATISVTIMGTYHSMYYSCDPSLLGYIDWSSFSQRVSAQSLAVTEFPKDIMVTPPYDPPCIPDSVSTIVSKLIPVVLAFLFVALFVGSILNIILELTYSIYRFGSHKGGEINWTNMLVSLVLVTVVVVLVFVLYIHYPPRLYYRI